MHNSCLCRWEMGWRGLRQRYFVALTTQSISLQWCHLSDPFLALIGAFLPLRTRLLPHISRCLFCVLLSLYLPCGELMPMTFTAIQSITKCAQLSNAFDIRWGHERNPLRPTMELDTICLNNMGFVLFIMHCCGLDMTYRPYYCVSNSSLSEIMYLWSFVWILAVISHWMFIPVAPWRVYRVQLVASDSSESDNRLRMYNRHDDLLIKTA